MDLLGKAAILGSQVVGVTEIVVDRLVQPDTISAGMRIECRAGRITAIDRQPAGAAALRLRGTLMPGFLDLQVNGGGGHSVDEATPAALDTTAAASFAGGATAFLPTLITAPWDRLLQQVAAVARWIRAWNGHGAEPIGLHLEGPFLDSPGVHDAACFVDPSPARVRELLFHRHTLPGFNDSGAHLSNLAFYDGNLLTLKIAAEEGIGRVSEAVRRLTRAPADFFGIDAGRLERGARADITVVDPEALMRYDSDASRQLVWRDELQAEQLVNRSDGVVSDVFIAGTAAWRGDAATPALGTRPLGQALRFAGRG